MFENLPLSARLNFGLREERNSRPDTISRANGTAIVRVDTLNIEPSGTSSGDLAIQYRHGTIGVVTVAGHASDTRSQLAVARNGRFTFDQSRDRSIGADAGARYALAGWTLEGQFTDAAPVSLSPRTSVVSVNSVLKTVDYRERATSYNRNLQVNAGRSFGSRFVFKATGQVSLVSYRYAIEDTSYKAQTGGQSVDLSNPRDDYRQSYRLEGTYIRPNGFTNTLGLDVQRVLTLNLDAEHSAGNREDRVYRVDWRWTYRLLQGLTATQRNQIGATYTRNPYAPDKDRLSMTYLTITTLNANVTPRLSVDLTHSASYRPNGDYVLAPDGYSYFNISDSNRDYTLVGHIGYTPAPFLTLTLDPTYASNAREGTLNGQPSPDNTRRSLTFTGGVSVNLMVAGRGRLSGTLNRNSNLSRNVKYTAGVPKPEPRSSQDYWQGSLQFSWSLQ
jgi:hypothetical protein